MTGDTPLSFADVRSGTAECVIRLNGVSRRFDAFLDWLHSQPAASYPVDSIEVLFRRREPDGSHTIRRATLPELVAEARERCRHEQN